MRKIVVAAMLLIVASEASAQSRHDVTGMTCAEVQQVVNDTGAALLTFNTNFVGLPRYDRYVRDQRECATGEIARRKGIPTSDEKYCVVRTCVASDIFTAG